MNYDAELSRYGDVFRRACGVRPTDRVLDVGCGAGQTTREAALAANAGGALGVDVSAEAIERARAGSPANAEFVCADVQAYEFVPGSFDLAISRFGTMFFADPVAAFTRVGRALRPGGRLVMLVWQAAGRNEWDVAIRRALGEAAHGGPDPFSLADPAVVKEILRAAGFGDVELVDAAEPVYYGADPDAALDWVRGFACTSAYLRDAGPAAGARALGRLRAALAVHLREDGVWFDSRAWVVSARAPTT